LLKRLRKVLLIIMGKSQNIDDKLIGLIY